MKKIMKLFITLIFSMLITPTFSAPAISEVFASLTNHKVTSGEFVQEKISPNLKRPLKSSGNFVFSSDGIVWQTVKPFPGTMAVTKESIIQISADGKKSVIDGSSNEVFKSVAATLSSLFSGSQKDLEQNFNIEKFEADGSVWKMTLSPKDKTIAQALKEIYIGGKSGKDFSLEEIRIVQGESNSTSYTLTNQVYKEALSDAEKEFFKK